MNKEMIYLDQAATSFPKPLSVCQSAAFCIENEGGNPGRGSHKLSMAASARLFEARESLCTLFGTSAPENVILTKNCTEAINTAMIGLLRPGDHFLISDIEHNAVYRTACALKKAGCSFDLYEADLSGNPETVLASIRSKLRPNTRMIVCCHDSNVLPVRLPIERIGALCEQRGLYFVIDAAQSAGHTPVAFKDVRASAICVPGHKGLFGIPGSGALLLSEKIAPIMIEPFLYGGSGSASDNPFMPEVFPDRLEAGTGNAPAAASLAAGVRFLCSVGIGNIEKHECSLVGRAKSVLQTIPEAEIYLPERESGGILLFNLGDYAAEDVAYALNERGICVRAGLHCAPLAHKKIGTLKKGAVRASFGWFNTPSDADALCYALRSIVRNGL